MFITTRVPFTVSWKPKLLMHLYKLHIWWQCYSPQYHASLSCYAFYFMLSYSLSCQLWNSTVQERPLRGPWRSLLT
jgi:hypothetical protein